MVKTQHFNGQDERTDEVLSRLRKTFRALSGVPLVADDAQEVDTLERCAMYRLCYELFNGPGTPEGARTKRWMEDDRDFLAGKGLPYYVLYAHYSIKTQGTVEIALALSTKRWEYYVSSCDMQDQAVPAQSHYEMSS